MNKLSLARGYGLIVGLIALALGSLALGSLAWFDSVRFTQEAGIALGATDFGTEGKSPRTALPKACQPPIKPPEHPSTTPATRANRSWTPPCLPGTVQGMGV